MRSDRSEGNDRAIKHRIALVPGALLIAIVAVAALTMPTDRSAEHIDSASVSQRPALADATADATASPAVQVDLSQPPATTDLLAPALVLPQSEDQGDPFLFAVGNQYYLYTSQPSFAGANVPVVSGSAVGDWGPVTDALPDLPAWTESGFTWAPDVHRFGALYVLYFTAILEGADPSMQCIGDAVGTTPAGPFVSQPTPFICQITNGGSIDPRVFTDRDGSTWMVWKSDENIGGSTTPTGIWTSRLGADGLTLVGPTTKIFAPDEPWQGTIVEAPDLVQVRGAYWLFYSANWFDQPAYGIGAASCAGPEGPCHDLGDQPLVSTNLQGDGPGEESVFVGRNGIWMLYNPWRSHAPTGITPPRPVAIARIGFGLFGPYLGTAPASVSAGL